MAGEIKVLSAHKLMHVRVTPCPQKIVAPSPVFVDSVLDAIISNRQDRSEKRGARPQAVVRRQVSTVKLFRACSPEPLTRIAKVPCIEVANLRSFNGDDATELSGTDRPRSSGTGRNNEMLSQTSLVDLARKPIIE